MVVNQRHHHSNEGHNAVDVEMGLSWLFPGLVRLIGHDAFPNGGKNHHEEQDRDQPSQAVPRIDQEVLGVYLAVAGAASQDEKNE